MVTTPRPFTINRFIVLCPGCIRTGKRTALFAREGATAFIYGREHQYTQVGGVLAVICDVCGKRLITDLDNTV